MSATDCFVIELNTTHSASMSTLQFYRIVYLYGLTHLPLDKMAAIWQTTFSSASSWMKSFVFWFEFHLSFFLGVQLTIDQHWPRLWLGAEQATSHYLNQCRPSSLTHIYGTRGEQLTAIIKCSIYALITIMIDVYQTMANIISNASRWLLPWVPFTITIQLYCEICLMCKNWYLSK